MYHLRISLRDDITYRLLLTHDKRFRNEFRITFQVSFTTFHVEHIDEEVNCCTSYKSKAYPEPQLYPEFDSRSPGVAYHLLFTYDKRS